MIVRTKAKRNPIPERKVGYIFTVKIKETEEVVGEYKSFPSIPISYCNESKYKITYRKDYVEK